VTRKLSVSLCVFVRHFVDANALSFTWLAKLMDYIH
jgi:hypothetical protein